jgi:hypothetical protein
MKRYGNPAGLKYHLKKGTCDIPVDAAGNHATTRTPIVNYADSANSEKLTQTRLASMIPTYLLLSFLGLVVCGCNSDDPPFHRLLRSLSGSQSLNHRVC